ncbi:aspartyl-phosphate phosphatase Spo0E family protein [Paenibacillus doosanensis]|uniref:Spo0E like sporulation regulatory protein n=1 Tax=Paenibacillus konkukensis TaxID=2020716 RepID=A0ABY4RUU0_9BACL|nr:MULTISPECIES: aspartyl-phosphate phosphatase Spo0E family protein [Paenibacillus]MCS7460803.1 aspartyl-phosphate phosphatase Spo0E family protein [Paenibacillus doosanensis]UQZ85983.1 Spo0E like sporulation regulatory protein [Paenibacillus konkukensis]
MAFPEYQLRQYINIGWIRENNQQPKWIFGRKKQSSSTASLEEEIYNLRLKLEQLVQTEKSLTSPNVVEISMLLDQKINEYMNRSKRGR